MNAPLPRKPRKIKHNEFTLGVLRALRQSAKEARKIAKMYDTPVCYMKDGKIVTERP